MSEVRESLEYLLRTTLASRDAEDALADLDQVVREARDEGAAARFPRTFAGFAERADYLFATGTLSVAEAYWQAACEALGVRLRPMGCVTSPGAVRGIGTWRARWREDGSPRQRSGFTTRREALEYAMGLVQEQRRNQA